MRLQQERESVAGFGRKLLAERLTTATGGNLSIFDRASGLVAISPSGMEYEEIAPEDVTVVDVEGRVVEGRRKPSSETPMHLALYRRRTDACAVVHHHAAYCSTLATLGLEIPPVHYLIAVVGDKVPLAPYATYGTQALADRVAESVGAYNAVLMANHGLVAVGRTLAHAYRVSQVVEYLAQIYWQARTIAEPVPLAPDELARLAEKFKTYGQ